LRERLEGSYLSTRCRYYFSEIKNVTEAEVSALGANSFAHLWQDGVAKAPAEREPDILRRMRTLVALARCLRRKMPPTATNVAANRASTSLAESEIALVLHDFDRREVLREKDGQFEFNLPIFKLWLVDVGISQLIADSLNEEITDLIFAEENKAAVKSEEVVALANGWPTYQGKHVGTDEIRTWLQQVESQRDQRVLFKLLQRTLFMSEALVRERLKLGHSLVRPLLPEFVIRKRTDRRFDVIVTFVDGAGKSGATYASSYAELNGIANDCVLSLSNFGEDFSAHVKKHGRPAAIVIVDDIAASGTSLRGNLKSFFSRFSHVIQSTKIVVLTIIATDAAQTVIETCMAELREAGLDILFRSCGALPDQNYAFPKKTTIWDTAEQSARARALCIDLGSRIYSNDPLGFGGMGLLVVFPTTVPNNTIPILHSYSRTGSKTWMPLFPRIVN
jgi:hypothetical protein